MTKTLGRMTDRLLAVLVPKTTAGACACNDSWCTGYYCPRGKVATCRANCDCSKVTCGTCRVGTC